METVRALTPSERKELRDMLVRPSMKQFLARIGQMKMECLMELANKNLEGQKEVVAAARLQGMLQYDSWIHGLLEELTTPEEENEEGEAA